MVNLVGHSKKRTVGRENHNSSSLVIGCKHHGNMYMYTVHGLVDPFRASSNVHYDGLRDIR